MSSFPLPETVQVFSNPIPITHNSMNLQQNKKLNNLKVLFPDNVLFYTPSLNLIRPPLKLSMEECSTHIKLHHLACGRPEGEVLKPEVTKENLGLTSLPHSLDQYQN